MCDCDCELPKAERWAAIRAAAARAEALREAAEVVLAEIKVRGIPADGGALHYRAVAELLQARAGITTSVELYPAYHGWFAQMTDVDGEWITCAPGTDRAKSADRVRELRARYPDRRHRLVHETTTYTEDPIE